MKCIVTGGAGFVGSHWVDHLLALGHEVIAVDNFSTGREEFLSQAMTSPRFRLIRANLLDPGTLDLALEGGAEWIFHFAANADVRHGLSHTSLDFEQNAHGTLLVLEAMIRHDCKRIVFSSTGSIYGDSAILPTPEDCPFPKQTSLYGASKLAAEGLIQAFCEGFEMQGLIFRFVSLLGARYTHGHVVDFVRKLKQDSSQLEILGNGKQSKSYLFVGDCLAAIDLCIQRPFNHGAEVYNLGINQTITVATAAQLICEELGFEPRFNYTGGSRGWVGDSPHIHLDCEKIKTDFGWKATLAIEQALRLTVRDVWRRES